MRFEVNPQLILTKDEFETLDKALKLCRDMDEETGGDSACENCSFKNDCTHIYSDCVYETARKALKKIIDVAIVKQGKPYFQFCGPHAGVRSPKFTIIPHFKIFVKHF